MNTHSFASRILISFPIKILFFFFLKKINWKELNLAMYQVFCFMFNWREMLYIKYSAESGDAQLSNYKVSVVRQIWAPPDCWTQLRTELVWSAKYILVEYGNTTLQRQLFFQNKEKFLFSCYFPQMDSLTAAKFNKTVDFLDRSCFKSRKVWKWWQKDRIPDQLIFDIEKVWQFRMLT